ncbi:Putative LOC101234274, partial [Caligus rogercresseyi]
DQISTFEEIQPKLDKSCLPSGIVVAYDKEWAMFYAVSFLAPIPELHYGLKINKDMSFIMFFNVVVVSQEEINYICPSKIIKRFSDINNILSFLKNRLSNPSQFSQIEIAKKCLKAALEDEDSNDHLNFVLELLDLHLKCPKGRRYSPKLLGISTLWQNTSPALYNQIHDSGIIICLQ